MAVHIALSRTIGGNAESWRDPRFTLLINTTDLVVLVPILKLVIIQPIQVDADLLHGIFQLLGG